MDSITSYVETMVMPYKNLFVVIMLVNLTVIVFLIYKVAIVLSPSEMFAIDFNLFD